MEKSLYILSACPECGGRLTGIIETGPRHRWLKDCKKQYEKHRCLLRYVEPRDYDRECFPNRFCHGCGYEWYQPEGFLHKDRYELVMFDGGEYEAFLYDTEFSFEPYLLNCGKKGFFLRMIKGIWNAFFARIYRIQP